MKPIATPHSLGSEPIPRLLVRYAVPAIIATVSTSLYNIIDSIFIGRGVGPIALSGLALAMPLMNILSAFGSMIGIGAAALLSIRLGHGDRSGAERTLGNAVALHLLVGAMLTLLGLLGLDPILRAFGASDGTIGYARDFMRIILLGTVVNHLFLGLNELIRASGHPRRAMAIMLVTVVLNCLLNPLFLFRFGWGVRGSALATVLAQGVALALTVAHFRSGSSFLRFRRGIFRLDRRIVGGILAIGLAPFLLHLCASAVVVAVNHALRATGGDEAIGAYGIVYRVAMLFLMVVTGLNRGMQPVVGYNYGAGRLDRVLGALGRTALSAVCVTSVGFLIAELLPRQAAMLFVDASDGAAAERMIVLATEGLRIALAAFPAVGFQIVASNFFQYVGKPRQSIFLSLTRQLLFLIPLLWLLPPRMGTRGVWLAMVSADAAASLLAGALLWRQLLRFRPGGGRRG